MSRSLRWAQDLAKPNLPKYVLRVMRTVSTSQQFDALSSRSRVILYYLSSLVDSRTRNATIFATKETIAEKTGCSTPTVYRALRELEQTGFIARLSQEFDIDRGTFKIGRILFTEKFFQIVGFPEASSISDRRQRGRDAAAANTDDADLREAPRPTSSEASPSLTVIDNTQEKPSYQKQKKSNWSSSAKQDSRRLPATLTWLVEHGLMTAEAVVKVMWKAKQVGQRVQDLLEAKRHLIESGQVGNLAGYLWTLLDSGEDFSYVARQAREADIKQQQASKLSDELKALLAGMAGKAIRLMSGAIWRPYNSSNYMELYDAEGHRRGIHPVNLRWFEEIRSKGYELIDDALVAG